MKAAGLDKEKLRDLDLEHSPRSWRALLVEDDALITSAHGSRRSWKRAEAFVLEFFPRSEPRLLADDSGTFDFLNATVSIRDDPVPTHQLDRGFAVVFNSNVVAEKILAGLRLTVLGNEEALHFNRDSIQPGTPGNRKPTGDSRPHSGDNE